MTDREIIEKLCSALARYVATYPAFRAKPIGALGPRERTRLDWPIQLEEDAMDALAKARGEK